MIKGLGVCPSKHGLKELRLFSLERGKTCMVRGLSYSLQEQEGCSLSDEKQLFPVSAEDGRRVELRLQVSLRSRSPESSRHRSRKRSGHFSISEWCGLLSFMALLTCGLFMTLKSIRETIQQPLSWFQKRWVVHWLSPPLLCGWGSPNPNSSVASQQKKPEFFARLYLPCWSQNNIGLLLCKEKNSHQWLVRWLSKDVCPQACWPESNPWDPHSGSEN